MSEICVIEEFKEKNSLLAPLTNKSVVDRIIDRITDAIISGEIKPGSKIPTEIELCESMGVGRNSVREAIKVLVSMGVLNIKRSEGTFVSNSFSNSMLNPLVYALILENDSSESIIELRRIVETGVIQLSIEKATDVDIKNIEDKLNEFVLELKKEDLNYKSVMEADIAFHRAIEESSHNNLMVKISSIIERITIPSRYRAIDNIVNNKDKQFLIDAHVQILKAIKEKDTVKVNEIMDNNYKYWKLEV